MMNPVSNLTKYTIDLIDVLDDDAKLLNFLRMERWIADRPDHPGRSRAPVVQGPLPGQQADQERTRAGRAHGRPARRSRCRCSTSTRPATPIIPVSCSQGVRRVLRHRRLHRGRRCRAATSARSSAARRRRFWRRRWPTGSRRAAADRFEFQTLNVSVWSCNRCMWSCRSLR